MIAEKLKNKFYDPTQRVKKLSTLPRTEVHTKEAVKLFACVKGIFVGRCSFDFELK